MITNQEMTNERPYYQNTYQQALEGLQDGLTVEICNEFAGSDKLIWLHELEAKYDFSATTLHPETLRALCHYASIAAGELTNTAVLFRQTTKMIGTGYTQQESSVHEFIVIPRSVSPEVKRTHHLVKRPAETTRHSGSAPAIRTRHEQRQISRGTSRLTGPGRFGMG